MGNKRKKVIITSVFVFLLVVGISFAIVVRTLSGTKQYSLLSSDLQLYLDESQNLTDVIESNLRIPVEDFEGKLTTGYRFSLINQGVSAADYTIYLDEDASNTMPAYALRYNLIGETEKLDVTGNIEDLGVERKLYESTIRANSTNHYELKIWLGVQAMNDAKNKTYSVKVRIEVDQKTSDYYDPELKGCDPVLTSNLIPVNIADDGTVMKADMKKSWYKYSQQEWANAVVLEDKTITYNAEDVIPETNIQSYFVWIPRYKYKIFDEGNYSSLAGSAGNKVRTIEVEFESKGVAVSNGSTKDSWLSHPAFQAFDTNGFWVGKFESGYNGAASAAAAQQNNSNPSNLIIKPNTYSWRNITVGNAFKASYDYMRNEESHMMKNTEWGAVALLQHTKYGSRASVRINNNASFLTGYAAVLEPTCGPTTNNASNDCNKMGTGEVLTQPYNTPTGYTASTTSNITGVYDMSGGAWEYVMGYNTKASSVGGSSGLTSLYGDFFSSTEWEKYYDSYSNTTETVYTGRILGDATGEMGPFFNVTAPNGTAYHNSSWYNDYGYFPTAAAPWFIRGGDWHNGSLAGVFSFIYDTGAVHPNSSFRVVLSP